MQRKKEFYDKLSNTRQGSIIIHNIIRTEPRKGKIWKCECDCGNVFEAATSSISNAKITQCPECGRKTNKEKSVKQLTTHGKSKTKLYGVWHSMISRCGIKTDTNYKFYGGRGISVCKSWKNDFVKFYEWAISNGYKEGLTIERKDNNKDYSENNCKWATMQEQANNKRTTRLITVDGITKTQTEWARLIGISHTAFCQARRTGKNIEKYTKEKLEKSGVKL